MKRRQALIAVALSATTAVVMSPVTVLGLSIDKTSEQYAQEKDAQDWVEAEKTSAEKDGYTVDTERTKVESGTTSSTTTEMKTIDETYQKQEDANAKAEEVRGKGGSAVVQESQKSDENWADGTPETKVDQSDNPYQSKEERDTKRDADYEKVNQEKPENTDTKKYSVEKKDTDDTKTVKEQTQQTRDIHEEGLTMDAAEQKKTEIERNPSGQAAITPSQGENENWGNKEKVGETDSDNMYESEDDRNRALSDAINAMIEQLKQKGTDTERYTAESENTTGSKTVSDPSGNETKYFETRNEANEKHEIDSRDGKNPTEVTVLRGESVSDTVLENATSEEVDAFLNGEKPGTTYEDGDKEHSWTVEKGDVKVIASEDITEAFKGRTFKSREEANEALQIYLEKKGITEGEWTIQAEVKDVSQEETSTVYELSSVALKENPDSNPWRYDHLDIVQISSDSGIELTGGTVTTEGKTTKLKVSGSGATWDNGYKEYRNTGIRITNNSLVTLTGTYTFKTESGETVTKEFQMQGYLNEDARTWGAAQEKGFDNTINACQHWDRGHGYDLRFSILENEITETFLNQMFVVEGLAEKKEDTFKVTKNTTNLEYQYTVPGTKEIPVYGYKVVEYKETRNPTTYSVDGSYTESVEVERQVPVYGYQIILHEQTRGATSYRVTGSYNEERTVLTPWYRGHIVATKADSPVVPPTPAEPETPDVPEEPDPPELPDTPEEPNTPEEPDAPVQPDSPAGTAEKPVAPAMQPNGPVMLKTSVPQTGDETNIPLHGFGLVLSMTAAGVVLRKRKNNDK